MGLAPLERTTTRAQLALASAAESVGAAMMFVVEHRSARLRRAAHLIEQARGEVARAIGADPSWRPRWPAP